MKSLGAQTRSEISPDVPDCPKRCEKARIQASASKLFSMDSDERDLVAWLVDLDFAVKNASVLASLPGGSLLLWNPDSGILPESIRKSRFST